MANPLKFGPVWVRNNGNTDMDKSNPPWATTSNKFSENFYLTERQDELKNSASGENNETSSIPSYSSVLRGSQSKAAQKEKQSANETRKSKELGVLFERNYRQRNDGKRGTSIKLVDSSISSISNGTSTLQNSNSVATNSKEYCKTNGDSNCWRNGRDLFGKKEDSLYEPAEKSSMNRVTDDFNHISSQRQPYNHNYYRDIDGPYLEKSTKSDLNVEENWCIENDSQQTNNKNKSSKSVRWVDEQNAKIRNNESYSAAQSMMKETYPITMSSPEFDYKLKDNHKYNVMDAKKDETLSSYENQGATFDMNKSNLTQPCYMSKEDIDMKLTESIKNLLKTNEISYPQPNELSSYETWPPSCQTNVMPPAKLHENPVTNPFILESSPVLLPNNQTNYQHNAYYHEQSTMNPNPMILQLPRMVIPALNDSVINNPFVAPAIRPPIMMVDPASYHLWYYRDPHCRDQGPFSSTEMAEWYSYGYFDNNLQLKRVCDTRYVTLGELIQICGNNMPFLASHLIPPLHNLPPSTHNPFS